MNGWDCPYYTNKGHHDRCILENPFENCDDFSSIWDKNDDYVDDDWEIKE